MTSEHEGVAYFEEEGSALLGQIDSDVGVGVAEKEDRQRIDLVGEEELVEEVLAGGGHGAAVERRIAIDVEVLADPADEGPDVELIRRLQLAEGGGE
jgi:hypothetical protein